MGVSATKKHFEHTDLIADRYRVDKTLGQGGMAVVYMVTDVSTDRQLALKHLKVRDDAKKQQKAIELFEREFHTLSHLSHPRIVEVYDYGIEAAGPYYTMELLDGGDLKELSPVDWKTACALLLDVCSALSLLHSRRMVHRDLSPRNVHCTRDGLAKLIDFGAMIPMGPCKQVVGTPSFTAPEVIDRQALDGRADLYSLGATLYFTLTGRNAYHAHDFNQLRTKWRMKPPAPSEVVPGIPKALDQLVMSLVSLDPAARPANAAEVIERLSAIAGLKVDEQLMASQAHLSAPTLVGRERHLTRLRKQLTRLRRGRGSTLLVQGGFGVGRSRFVDVCVLESKLMGATVVRTDAGDGQAGPYRAVGHLVEQLLQAAPEEAPAAIRPRVGILGHVLPELLDRFTRSSLDPIEESTPIRPLVQTKLRECFFDVSQKRPLLVAVDDFHRTDEASAAFLAFLGHRASRYPLILVCSTQTGESATSESALKLLADTGVRIELENLSAQETEQLLGSVFGEVPRLRLIADALHAISAGNPRDIMQLAQHLVDKRAVRYRAGAWSLPHSIDSAGLPSSMAQALKVRIETLNTDARGLVDAMTLSPGHSYAFEDCLVLTEHGDSDRLLKSLEELIAADVLNTDGEHFFLSQQAWVSILRDGGQKERDRELHLRLSSMFEARNDDGFRVARHLLRAGEDERGLDVLLDYTKKSTAGGNRDTEAYTRLIQSRPSGWLETYQDAIGIAKKLNRPSRQIHKLLIRWSNFVWLSDTDDTAYLRELTQQLYRDSGLAFYHELDDSMDSMARLTRALELAQERYDNRSDQEFVLEPALAIRQLARVIIETQGIVVTSSDYALLESVPSLQPLFPLSPALRVVEGIAAGLTNRIAGRYERAGEVYREIMDRISQPDRAGLDENHHKHTRLAIIRGMGMMEASMGLRSALEWAEAFEEDGLDKVSALQIRAMYHLWQGNTERARQYKQRTELLRIQTNSIELHKGSYVARELIAFALSDNLTGLKSIIGDIEEMAKRYEAWKPIRHLARGEYQRIRGDHQSALDALGEARRLTKAGRDQGWAEIAGAYVKTLFELGRYEEARSVGQEALEEAAGAGLGYMCNYIKMPLALAQAKLGDAEAAVKTSQSVVDSFKALGSTGINLGLSYETRARVAICTKNPADCNEYIGLCSEQFCSKGKRALIAKYERLLQEAQEPAHGICRDSDLALENVGGNEHYWEARVAEALASCGQFRERAQCVLKVLVDNTETAAGFLYTMQKEGPVLSAQTGIGQPSRDIDKMAREYLAAELDETTHVTVTGMNLKSTAGSSTAWTVSDNAQYRPVLLGHHSEKGYAITGLAVLLLDATGEFKMPFDVIMAVSRALCNSGDVESRIASC